MSADVRREDFADELRGVALLGIVTVNVPFLGVSSVGFTDASVAAAIDRLAAFLVVAFAQGKFYLLFAFLFGYSLSFLLTSSRPDTRRRYLRRLVGLAVLGLAHAAFGFIGDILLLYAVLGVIPLWLWHRSARQVAAVSFSALALWLVLLGALAMIEPATSASASGLADFAQGDQTLATGTFVESVRARLHLWPSAFTLIAVLNGLPVIAMFAWGVLAGRVKLLANPEAFGPLWRRGFMVGAIVGLPCGLFSAWLSVGPGVSPDASDSRQAAGVLIGFVGAPALTLGYISLLALARTRWIDVLKICRPAGRMSLTGYLGESILLSFIFCGYGLGLFGRVGAATAIGFGLIVWVILDIFAHLWQRRFGSGPFEALLRWWSSYPPVIRERP